MKTTEKLQTRQKRTYAKPNIKHIQLDNQFSMVMMSFPSGPPPNPERGHQSQQQQEQSQQQSQSHSYELTPFQ